MSNVQYTTFGFTGSFMFSPTLNTDSAFFLNTQDQHSAMVEYHVPNAPGGVADIFSQLESNKHALRIKHFSVSQTTLDEVRKKRQNLNRESEREGSTVSLCGVGEMVAGDRKKGHEMRERAGGW